MSEMREATIYMAVTIEFDDNGDDDMKDQAKEQLMLDCPGHWAPFVEIDRVVIDPKGWTNE